VQSIAKKFQIPRTTLNDRLHGKEIVRGNIFTLKEEEALLSYIRNRQQGNPIGKEEFIDLVNRYLQVSSRNFKIIFSEQRNFLDCFKWMVSKFSSKTPRLVSAKIKV